MDNVFSYLLDLMFPPKCPSCGKAVPHEGEWCEACFNYLYEPRIIELTGQNPLKECLVLAHYERGVRRLLQDIKFNDKKNKKRALAPFLVGAVHWLQDIDMVIPVPISEDKRKARGYNQVELLFKAWVMEQGKAWEEVLYKENHRRPMWGLSKEERQKNIKGAFSYHASLSLRGQRILIVDDILTTGATLKECAEVLAKERPKIIKALTFAGGALGLPKN